MTTDFKLENLYTNANIILLNSEQGRNEIFNSFVSQLKEREDLNYLFFNEDEENGKNLKLEEVFAIRSFFISYYSGKRFVLINKNLRNTVIQNSLLKILEELKASDYIVIFSDNVNVFIPTILSRVALIDLNDNASSNVEIKNKLIKSHQWNKLTNLLKLEDEYKRGLIGDKQWKDFLDVL